MCNLEGSRGVDYKFYRGEPAYVILAYTPHESDHATIVQALARGCRDFNKSCKGGLVVETEQWNEYYEMGDTYDTVINTMAS